MTPRNSSSSESSGAVSSGSTDHKSDTGFLRLRLTYTVDHVLQASAYSELWQLLLDGVSNGGYFALDASRWMPDKHSVTHFELSPAGILEHLPRIELEEVEDCPFS